MRWCAGARIARCAAPLLAHGRTQLTAVEVLLLLAWGWLTTKNEKGELPPSSTLASTMSHAVICVNSKACVPAWKTTSDLPPHKSRNAFHYTLYTNHII
jgi:hypothetical protein